jgi:hypothetical protein
VIAGVVSRKRRARRGSGQLGGTFRLLVVLAILVGINVYVFFFAPGSLKQVSQAAQAASTHEPEGKALEPEARVPSPVATAAKGSRKDGVVREHEGLGGVLRREGLAAADADAVLRALQPIMGFKRDLHAGQKYTLRTRGDGRLEEFELHAAPGVVFTVARVDGKWVGKKSTPPASEKRGSASARSPAGTP